MIAARRPGRRRRRRRGGPADRQLTIDFNERARIAAFRRKLADPPPERPDEPERLGDVLARSLRGRL